MRTTGKRTLTSSDATSFAGGEKPGARMDTMDSGKTIPIISSGMMARAPIFTTELASLHALFSPSFMAEVKVGTNTAPTAPRKRTL